jgi:polygalacturonase
MHPIDHSRRDLLKLSGKIGSLGLAAAAVPTAYAAAELKGKRTAGGTRIAAPLFYDVRTYGAIGDGKAYDTTAFDKALAACSSSGGGTVYVPAGTYLCYTIHLRSNVELYLAQGSVIIAADTPAEGAKSGPTTGYDAPEPNTAWDAYQDFGHNHWHNSLLWGEDLHDLSITGPGLLWGKGLSAGHGNHPLPSGVGNKTIALKNCRNVQLRDFSVKKGGHFALLLTAVDQLMIHGLTLDTDRDGLDLDCCKNVHVSNCTVNSPEDDGICLKSSYGLGYSRSCDNITITNCLVTARYEIGTLIDGTVKPVQMANRKLPNGRMKAGTESNGGFRNISISNCVFDHSRGLALESADGAILEDIVVSNLTLRETGDLPLFIRLCARMRGPADAKVGVCRRIKISNINSFNSLGLYPAIIAGIPDHPIEDVSLTDLYFHTVGGADKKIADTEPSEMVKGYPDPTKFPMMFPAHGLFLRHIRNLEMTNIEFRLQNADARPAIWAHDVQGMDIFRLKTPPPTGSSNFFLREVSDFRLFGSPRLADKTIAKTDHTTF